MLSRYPNFVCFSNYTISKIWMLNGIIYHFLVVIVALTNLEVFNLVLIYFSVVLSRQIFFLIPTFYDDCRYVGNIHPQVTETDLQQIFSTTGPLESCKLIRKEKVKLPFLNNFCIFGWLKMSDIDGWMLQENYLSSHYSRCKFRLLLYQTCF